MLLPILTLSLAGVAALWCLQQKKRRLRDIQDEVVVIIGASSGVGLETARLYARSWTDHPRRVLHVVARRREIEDVKDEISRTTGCEHIYAHVSDASSAEDIAALAENLRQRSGKIDTLIYW